MIRVSMRCKCGGKLERFWEGCDVWACIKCGREWDLDFSLFPIVDMEPHKPVRPPMMEPEI